MCQSCGRPLNEEVKGTEADGSLSSVYCNLCYEKGAFKDPSMTVEQMQAISMQAMQDMHLPRIFAKMIARSQVPKLKRWQK